MVGKKTSSSWRSCSEFRKVGNVNCCALRTILTPPRRRPGRRRAGRGQLKILLNLILMGAIVKKQAHALRVRLLEIIQVEWLPWAEILITCW